MSDKTETLITVLDRYQTRYNPNRNGEQSISCPNTEAHTHGDRNPSCSLNLGKGVLYCQGCGLSGDAYSIIMQIEHIEFLEATEQIGKPRVEIESDWLIL